MGKKNDKKKKGKGAEKTAMKTEKNAEKKLKKILKAKGEESIESLIAEYQDQSKSLVKHTEEKCEPPSARSSAGFVPHPEKDQLVLFGGEFFKGNKTFMYNDLFFYTIKSNSWSVLKTPTAPPPRSSHQMVPVKHSGGQLWIFGGEFASPSQSQYYHYKDLWVFHFHSNKWEKVNVPGGPSARSGHRMVYCKRNLFIFGGFHDTLKGDYKVYNDLYLFSLDTYSWCEIKPAGIIPPPRSGCCLAVAQDEKSIVMFGGYSKQTVKKDVHRGIVHTDMFILAPDGKQEGVWQWQQMKQGGARPSPRCSCALVATPGNRALVFGGVVDEEDDEDLEGKFYNDMYSVELDKGKWHQVHLKGKKDPKEKKKRRRRKQVEEMEATDANQSDCEEDNLGEDIDELTMEEDTSVSHKCQETTDGAFTVSSTAASTSGASSGAHKDNEAWWPSGRMNAMLVVKQGILYMFGGMYEDGEKQLTLQDMYSLDLHKLDEWKVLIANEKDKLVWEDSDSDLSDSDDSENSDDDEDDDSDEMELGEAPPMKKDEAFNDYFSRTKDYWLEEADELAEKDGLTVTAKQLKKAAYRMAEEFAQKSASN